MRKETIISNKGQCLLCGDIIQSLYTHDYITCRCGACSVDGGVAYLKRGGDPENFVDMSEVEYDD